MLESLARCLTELCAFDFFWNFLSFWPFSFIILASLSISSVFSSMCQVSVNPQNLDILRAIIKSLSYQVWLSIDLLWLSINQSFVIIRSLQKIIMKEKTLVLVVTRNSQIHYLNSGKIDLDQLIYVDFGNLNLSTWIFSVGLKLFIW